MDNRQLTLEHFCLELRIGLSAKVDMWTLADDERVCIEVWVAR